MPLTRKLLVLLSALILIFCAVISLFQYRIRLSQVMQARQAELAEQAFGGGERKDPRDRRRERIGETEEKQPDQGRQDE